jgi:PleD family two-component response regulator
MPEGLLQAADHALYRANGEGRNRFSKALLFAPTEET